MTCCACIQTRSRAGDRAGLPLAPPFPHLRLCAKVRCPPPHPPLQHPRLPVRRRGQAVWLRQQPGQREAGQQVGCGVVMMAVIGVGFRGRAQDGQGLAAACPSDDCLRARSSRSEGAPHTATLPLEPPLTRRPLSHPSWQVAQHLPNLLAHRHLRCQARAACVCVGDHQPAPRPQRCVRPAGWLLRQGSGAPRRLGGLHSGCGMRLAAKPKKPDLASPRGGSARQARVKMGAGVDASAPMILGNSPSLSTRPIAAGMLCHDRPVDS